MGVATTVIGLLPTYAEIGVVAPLGLIFCRFAQGLAIGGQWGGAMLLVTENAPSNKRGFYGAFAQAGAPMGVILANLAFLLVSATVSDEAFMSWGWRVPFLVSIVLVALALYVQFRLEDTPAFKALQKAKTHEPEVAQKTSPVVQALKRFPKQIFLGAGGISGGASFLLHLHCFCRFLWYRSRRVGHEPLRHAVSGTGLIVSANSCAVLLRRLFRP